MGFEVEKWLSHPDVYKLLVSKGFKVMEDLSEGQRENLLREVIRKNDLGFFTELLQNGLKSQGVSTLILVIQSQQEDDLSIVKYLIENGCPVNIDKDENRDKLTTFFRYQSEKVSPLFAAIRNKFPKIAEFLLRHGAKVEKKELEAVGKSLQVEFVELLKRCDVDLNTQHAAVLKAALDPIYAKHDVTTASCQINMIRAILAAGVDPNTKSRTDGTTCGHHFALMLSHCSYLSKEQKGEILDLLISYGLDMNGTCTQGGTTMLYHCHWLDTDLLEVLLSRGADPNHIDNTGCKASPMKINYLVDRGDMVKFPEIFDLLIKYNADLNSVDNEDDTILTKILINSSLFYAKKPVTRLLQVTEIGIPTEKKIKRCVDSYNNKCVLPLIQAGCCYPSLLRHLSHTLLTLEAGFGFDDVAGCADPTFGLNKDIDDAASILETSSLDIFQNSDSRHCVSDARFVFYKKAYPLKCLAIHAIRKQILTANGNKSLIPRARKLPLPRSLIENITLECYQLVQENDEYVSDGMDSDEDDDDDGFDYYDNDSIPSHGLGAYFTDDDDEDDFDDFGFPF